MNQTRRTLLHFLSVLMPTLVLLTLAALRPAPDAMAVWQRYGQIPKGVALEGGADGFDQILLLDYDRASNAFIVNETQSYPNPVTREEMIELIEFLQADDRIGVSAVINTTTKVLERTVGMGRVRGESRVARALMEADLLMAGVLFGWHELLTGKSLPDDYVPLAPEQEKVKTVAFNRFSGYRFHNDNDVWRCDFCTFDVLLIPMAEERAGPGGYLPDMARIERGEYEPAYKANKQHIDLRKAQYLSLPELTRASKIGEAVAFLRHVRDCRFDLNALKERLQY